MAVLGLAILLLVVIPGLLYFSLAFVMRSARLTRGRERGGMAPLVWPERGAKADKVSAE